MLNDVEIVRRRLERWLSSGPGAGCVWRGKPRPAPAAALRARGGVSVGSGATHVPLGLHAIGYGAALSAACEVAPRANGNGVVYERAGLSEWYPNGSCTARLRSMRENWCYVAFRELTLKSSGHPDVTACLARWFALALPSRRPLRTCSICPNE